MEAFLIIAGLIFGLWQIRSVTKYQKKINREESKGKSPLDKFL